MNFGNSHDQYDAMNELWWPRHNEQASHRGTSESGAKMLKLNPVAGLGLGNLGWALEKHIALISYYHHLPSINN